MKANFAKYGLLDDRVVFLDGWFKDTLPAAPIERLAVLRLDGDMYESTMEALTALYDKVSTGGFVIIDDYGCIDACRKAVHDFRDARGIAEKIVDIDGWGVYWRKSLEATAPKLAPVLTPAARPFWSVVVPLYNRKAYLKRCLDCVLEQDPGPDEMEILVVDDASPSDLSGLVHEAGRGRVRYIRNASNLGLYPSTNAAIGMTSGRFIHILHDDDWVENGFYRKMREAIEACPDNVGVAFCQYETFYERSGRTWSPPPFRATAGLMDRNFLFRLATECPLNLPAVVFARETFERIGLFRADLPMMADWEWLRAQRDAMQLASLAGNARALAHPPCGPTHRAAAGIVRGAARFSPNARNLRPDPPGRRRVRDPARGANPEDETLSRGRGRMPAQPSPRPRQEKRLGSLRARRRGGGTAGIRRTPPAAGLRVAQSPNPVRRACACGRLNPDRRKSGNRLGPSNSGWTGRRNLPCGSAVNRGKDSPT